jgi:hypothetical protein
MAINEQASALHHNRIPKFAFIKNFHERKEAVYRVVRRSGYLMNRRGLWNSEGISCDTPVQLFHTTGTNLQMCECISTGQNKNINTGFHQF